MRISQIDTVRDVCTKLRRILAREGLIDEYFAVACDYAKAGDPVRLDSTFSEIGYRWVAVFPVTGGSEGIYVHADLIGCKAEWNTGELGRYPMAFIKTWTWENAWNVTRRVAELLGA